MPHSLTAARGKYEKNKKQINANLNSKAKANSLPVNINKFPLLAFFLSKSLGGKGLFSNVHKINSESQREQNVLQEFLLC